MLDEKQHVGAKLTLLRFDEAFLQLERSEITHSAKVFIKKHSRLSTYINFYRPSRVVSSSTRVETI
jgi:hypothetical protein